MWTREGICIYVRVCVRVLTFATANGIDVDEIGDLVQFLGDLEKTHKCFTSQRLFGTKKDFEKERIEEKKKSEKGRKDRIGYEQNLCRKHILRECAGQRRRRDRAPLPPPSLRHSAEWDTNNE